MNRLVTAVLSAAALATGAQAQNAPPSDAPRVFLDCSYFCDQNYIRTEISFVNWVRDQSDALVHVLVTRQSTGGGGAEWKLNFIGLKERAGKADTLAFSTSSNDSEDVVRQGMARMLKAGLIPYLVNTSLAGRLQIGLQAATPATSNNAAAGPARDPWNYWVFTLSARTNMDGESSQNFRSVNGSVSANRTTEALKVRVSMNFNENRSEFTYPVSDTRDTTIVATRKNRNFNLLAVKSLGSHWSVGFESGANSATFGNIELGVSGGPAIEFSVWPYSEATRRSLTFRYNTSIRRFDYDSVTIYDKMEETHPAHSINGELNLRQRWGNVSFESTFSQYLHDTQFYNAGVFGNANVRLFKGFSVDFFGNYNRVRDQLSLKRGNLSQDQVLLRQRELATGYRYFFGTGIRYSFGSIFNNVVNPRFGEGGGGGVMFF